MNYLLYYPRRLLACLVVTVVRSVALLFYDKKYLTGKYFQRWHFSSGWQWVLRCWFHQKVLGENRDVPWPVPPYFHISNPRNIIFDPDDMRNFQTAGSYFQAIDGKIILGKGCYIAPGVGLITTNHDPANADHHLPGKDIVLGEGCWLGMNAVVLPGVTLGPHTSVGAGAVVTKSFPEGYCVLAGNPARKIKEVRCLRMKDDIAKNAPPPWIYKPALSLHYETAPAAPLSEGERCAA